jgi:hypothetical protein
MTNLVQLLSGRKRESGIWDYFTYNKDTDKSECKVIAKSDKVCGKLVAGKNATNLKAHVRAVHPSVYAEFEKKHAPPPSKKKKTDKSGMKFEYALCCCNLQYASLLIGIVILL